jgi:uncharacterized protein (DUF2141 family)
LKYLKKMIFVSRQNLFFVSVLIVSFMMFHLIYAQTQTGKIIVHVNGFKNNNGKARLLIFSTKEKEFFPKEKDKAFAKYVVSIKDNKVLFTFENLPYGDYAISVHHDEDNNGKVNSNLLGIPNEGLGASNDAKGFFGPPSFEKAKVTLKKEQISIIINMVNQSN